MTFGRPLRLAVKLVVTGALLYVVFWKIPFADVARLMRSTDPTLFALGTALLFVMRWLASLRLRVLTAAQGTPFSVAKIYEISLIAGFYAMLLPGSLAGGAVRWYRMNRNVHKPAEVLTAIAFDRLVDTLMVVVMGAAFWIVAEHGDDSDLGGTLLAVVSTLSTPRLLFALPVLPLLFLGSLGDAAGHWLLRSPGSVDRCG